MANETGKGSGNPSGARRLVSSAFLRDLARVWNAKGEQALNKLADEDPATLVRVCASVLPKQLEGGDEYNPIQAAIKVTFVRPQDS